MDQKYVFISYKADDFDRVMPIKTHLETNGIPCWMAPMSIRGGLSYAQEIPPAIQNCSVFLLFLTAKAQESKWVPREVDQAINCEKVVMPFMPEDCPLREDFGFYLTNVQRYEAFRAPEETLERMTRDIQQLLGIEPVEEEGEEEEEEVTEELPPKPEKGKKPATKKKKISVEKKKRLPWILSGVAAVLLLLTVLLWPHKSEVGGLRFDVNDASILLENAELTQEDLNKLSEFKNLYAVRMENCSVSAQDLSPLALPELMTLELKNCGLTNAQLATVDFSALPDLRSVDVSGNPQLTQIGSLKTLAASLTELNISDTGIKEFEWISEFTKLEILRADRTGLRNMNLLEEMIYLEKLSLSGNGITALEGLKNTSKLSEVDLSHNKLSDVSVLGRSASQLKVLHVEDNTLTELDCLTEAKKLEKLYLDQNSLQDLNFLKGHEELRVLSASKNRIESIFYLRIGGKIRYMNLANNKLRSVATGDLVFGTGDLAFGDGEYVVLDLSNNGLQRLSLPDQCTYKLVNLLGNPDLPLASLQNVKGWDLYFDFSDEVSVKLLNSLDFTGLRIVDCPLDRRVEMEEGLANETLMTKAEALKEIEEKEAKEKE